MKRFHLFTGNRMEKLVGMLGDVLSAPPASPMTSEVVVVQSKGMERWLSMSLARRHGICANIRFPFPNAFVYDDIFRKLLPDLPEISPFDPGVMVWKIMKILPGVISEPGFPQLKNYLGDGRSDLKLYQLATRIADTFDQYLLFRPEMILDWEAGRQEDGWQSALWRELAKGNESRHRAALGRALLDALRSGPELVEALPDRICVFGISTLPEFHIRVLDALSDYREVSLFLMNPCADYWGDLLSGREKRRIIRRGDEKGLPEEDLYLGTGNSFLAAMGMMGRDFFDLINEYFTKEQADFESPGEATLLASIQSDILNRRERPSESVPRKTISPDDTSVVIHTCHSPMREAEVLRDHLLALFEADPTLRPGDVLVMTPDIEACAPYILAVFDRPGDDPRRIPFSIADRGIRMESRIIDTFLNILDLSGSRFGAAQVLAVLESPPVCRKFGLTGGDLETVRHWVRETRIRWGADGRSRARMGLPEIWENTWRAGLDRLLLGYAMTGENEILFRGVLPYDRVEGGEAAVLGQFAEFADRLFFRVGRLSRSRTPGKWAAEMTLILEEFFQPDEATEGEFQIVRDTLRKMGENARLAGFDGRPEIGVIRCHLAEQLRHDLFGFGFITGGVTFCAMLPMRSIPFRVICLMGISSDDYPRQTRSPGFDLMAGNYRPGDRSRRNDDRYLFLEAILSAREKLCISYVGQSIRDNSAIPPSVLVSDLTDYIVKGFALPEGDILKDHILTVHRLQAFSPAYFGGPDGNGRLFSYSEENCRAARRLAEPRKVRAPFFSGELPEPDAAWKSPDLRDLTAFFSHPARFLLTRRLEVWLEEEDGTIEERELFDVSGLDKYRLAGYLVEKRLGGRNLQALLPARQKAGELPHGTVGTCAYEQLCREADGFARRIAPHVADDPLAPADVTLDLNGFRISGRITGLYPRHRVCFRCAKVKPGDSLTAWIGHLALNCSATGDLPRHTLLAGTDGIWEFPPVENAGDVLETLLGIYWQGLKAPLPFFPLTSWAFAEQLIGKGKTPEEALGAARTQWAGGYYSGEAEDPYLDRCFGHTDPLDQMFCTLAAEILEPLLACRKKV
ncbi:exodeoxyribonuclease V subunit gamma [Desulfonema ishimotonii]|uniref:Exodeoxyribonuclease V subunit gamma n=1 Tax=Desulfonema ishimotonii TaxID=45657 RepID=A0A401FYH8_9BACT|nr:exodeoxyribonuclease V subunit gamma [Desulfonema ishimotonii]GBC62010.1 exodeoxyribonuclease V subunit gamma [Desulfonema ishimotonii]